MIPNSLIKEIAERIILSHTEDIEYLSINEMTFDMLANHEVALELSAQDTVVNAVDALVRKAKVTVEFPEV